MKKWILISLIFSNAQALINGKFSADFARNDLKCRIEATINQKEINKITFINWDELCEDKLY
jgi:hypothetical protein